jgi:predicted DNA-binding transcriptional regulator AlpA
MACLGWKKLLEKIAFPTPVDNCMRQASARLARSSLLGGFTVNTATLTTDQAVAIPPQTRRMLDAKAVGVRLGCSWRHVLRLADRGAMPWGLKLGSLRRWDADEIERWIADGCPAVRKGAGR